MASASIKFKIEGMADFTKKISQLSPSNRKSIMTVIVRRASGVVRRQMRSAMPARSGILRKAVRAVLYHRYDTVGTLVGVEGVADSRRGKKPNKTSRGFNKFGAEQVPAWYGKFVQSGRQAFTQKFNTKIGVRYFVKGHQGLWTATKVIPIVRNIGAQAGVDYLGKSVSGVEMRMKNAMTRALNSWFDKRGY